VHWLTTIVAELRTCFRRGLRTRLTSALGRVWAIDEAKPRGRWACARRSNSWASRRRSPGVACRKRRRRARPRAHFDKAQQRCTSSRAV